TPYTTLALGRLRSLSINDDKFLSFKNQYKLHYNNKAPCNEFLTWFIGFTEGDGSFVCAPSLLRTAPLLCEAGRGGVRSEASKTRNSLQFVITQSTEDINILHYIKETLGFGTVIKQGVRTSRYVVQDLTNLYLIILLFNGNIVLPTRKKNFKEFLEIFNQKIIKKGSCEAACAASLTRVRSREGLSQNFKASFENKVSGATPSSACGAAAVELKSYDNLPSIKDAWLSGFTDAEGCFTVSFLKESNAFRLRYLVSQKGDSNLPILSSLILLFKAGRLEAHSKKSNYSYILSGEKSCYNIYDYFNKFPLKTKKSISLGLWKEIHSAISNKEHLDLELRNILIEKAKKVNAVKRKSK
uniref:LAGLIDADG endonuclease n=1 Tax=Pallidohirschioporus biformis TaxID=50381 RepID=UPI002E797125